MKILVDEMFDGWDERLQGLGHDAYSVKKLRKSGAKLGSDYSVLSYAKENGMVLLTQDAENCNACKENGIPCICLDEDAMLGLVLEKLKGLT